MDLPRIPKKIVLAKFVPGGKFLKFYNFFIIHRKTRILIERWVGVRLNNSIPADSIRSDRDHLRFQKKYPKSRDAWTTSHPRTKRRLV